MDGVVQFAPEEVTPVLGVPVVNAEPPVEAEYQTMSLPALVAEIVNVPLPQRVLPVPVGTDGNATTVMDKVLSAATQGRPFGLLLVIVTVTVLPTSDATGIYSIVNGEIVAGDEGVNVPPPLLVTVTDVAEPPKVLPLMEILFVSQVEAVDCVSVTVGGVAQLQFTLKDAPTDVHWVVVFLTVIV